MRQLETFSAEAEARAVADALYADGIEATVSASREGGFGLWVHDDARLEDARALMAHFRAHPDDPKYTEGVKLAREKKREAERKDKEAEKRVRSARRDLERRSGPPTATLFFVLAAVGVYVMQGTVGVEDLMSAVMFAGPDAVGAFDSIARGEVWRLITPSFIPGPFFSLFFASLFLLVLGNAFEQRHRSRYLVLLALTAAIAGNVATAQLFGASAVYSSRSIVAAIFAYLFVRHRLDPRSWDPPPFQTTFWIPLWFLVALVVSSMRHFACLEAAGFVVGGLAGLMAARR